MLITYFRSFLHNLKTGTEDIGIGAIGALNETTNKTQGFFRFCLLLTSGKLSKILRHSSSERASIAVAVAVASAEVSSGKEVRVAEAG